MIKKGRFLIQKSSYFPKCIIYQKTFIEQMLTILCYTMLINVNVNESKKDLPGGAYCAISPQFCNNGQG